jgi:Fe-S-cluster containining protein
METILMRKRTSLVSKEEREFYIWKHPEIAKDENSAKYFEEEVDIPAHYKLEKKIIKEFLQETNMESAYKFVEQKRGLDFANKLRKEFGEDNANKGVSYGLKKGSIIPMMKKFLTYVDELNNIYKIYSPCKKVCSSCCDIPVAVSDLEIIIIKEYLDKNHIAYKKLSNTEEKLKGAEKIGIIGEQYTGIKCPFLKDNNCYIYSVRPFVCRKYITIGICNMEDKNKFVDEGYIIGMTYEYITTYHIRKNLDRYVSILDPMQIKVTKEGDLDGVYNIKHWQKYSDIRDNFSNICFI